MKSFIEHLRTLFILGRVSNLPTVWSNLIVGWALANGNSIGPGHGPATPTPLLLVLFGGSFLYVGGMYLNDYFDSAFDARYCQMRPIPAGKISRRTVGFLTVLWFTAGFACYISFGPVTIVTTLLLITAIIAYDFHHKDVAWAPLLMGACRCLLYLLAFSAFRESFYFSTVDGSWWNDAFDYIRSDFLPMTLDLIRFFPAAIPLGLYIAGITYLARGESRPQKPTRWALVLLFVPVVFAYCVRAGSNIPYAPWLLPAFCLLQIIWMAWLLIPFWRKSAPSIGRIVSGLIAGIVLVDMIALLPTGPLGIVLLPLFAFALLLQRIIPAT